MTRRHLLPALFAATLLAGCQSAAHAPLAPGPRVDLERFMGDWYVIASIPTFLERDAFDAVESYRLDPDGSIRTTFRFRAGSFDGEQRTYTMRGLVQDRATNAAWEMQVIWPFRSDYRIAWVDPEYTSTVIAREARDHAWIMARTPTLPQAQYRHLVSIVEALGYDAASIRRVPHRGEPGTAQGGEAS